MPIVIENSSSVSSDNSFGSNPDNREFSRVAAELYSSLRSYVQREDNVVCLDGFYSGNLCSRATAQFLQCELMFPLTELKSFPDAIDHYYQAGFSEDELSGGLFLIRTHSAVYYDRTWHMQSFDPREQRRTLVAARSITQPPLVVDDLDSPVACDLHDLEKDLLRAVIDLSALPFKVNEHFPSYPDFRRAVAQNNTGSTDWARIENVSLDGSILFNGGLQAFVQIAKERRIGEKAIDSTELRIADILDRRDHLTKMRRFLK